MFVSFLPILHRLDKQTERKTFFNINTWHILFHTKLQLLFIKLACSLCDNEKVGRCWSKLVTSWNPGFSPSLSLLLNWFTYSSWHDTLYDVSLKTTVSVFILNASLNLTGCLGVNSDFHYTVKLHYIYCSRGVVHSFISPVILYIYILNIKFAFLCCIIVKKRYVRDLLE